MLPSRLLRSGDANFRFKHLIKHPVRWCGCSKGRRGSPGRSYRSYPFVSIGGHVEPVDEHFAWPKHLHGTASPSNAPQDSADLVALSNGGISPGRADLSQAADTVAVDAQQVEARSPDAVGQKHHSGTCR